MSFILILSPKKKLWKLVQEASLTWVVIQGLLHRSTKAARQHVCWSPHSPSCYETWVLCDPGAWQVCTALLPSQTTGHGTCPSTDDPWRRIILTTELVQKRGRGGDSFSLCVQNHSKTWQAEATFLVIHLRSRVFSSSPKVVNCYLCEIILQGPGQN